jgi:hypothetical protein
MKNKRIRVTKCYLESWQAMIILLFCALIAKKLLLFLNNFL